MLDDHNIDTTVRESASSTVQPVAARHRAGRRDPLLHDRLGRLHHPGEKAPQIAKAGSATSSARFSRVAGYAARHRGFRRTSIPIRWTTSCGPHHTREPADRYPHPIPGGRGQTFMPAERMTAGTQQWTASNTRFEAVWASMPRCVRLRERLPRRSTVDRSNQKTSFEEDIDNAKSRMVGW